MYYYNNIHQDHSLILDLEPSLSATTNLQKFEIIFSVDWNIDSFSSPGPGQIASAQSTVKLLEKHIKNSSLKYIFILMNLHIWEGQFLGFFKEIFENFQSRLPNQKIFIVHQNAQLKDKNIYGLIYNDFLFNRTKLYFTDYKKLDLSNRLWSHSQTKKTYTLQPIPERKKLKKIWLTLNKFEEYSQGNLLDSPGHIRWYFRHQFSLFCNYKKSFYGNPQRNEFLPGEELGKPFHGWQPVANKYYNFSLISAYVETLPIFSYEEVRCVTEKTFDPLIKGHFILPFAYPTFIDDCKQYGFQFPEFINYEYDKIRNDQARFAAWKNEYLRLDSIPKLELESLYKMNLSILQHNRNIFWERPYDYFIPRWRNIYNILN